MTSDSLTDKVWSKLVRRKLGYQTTNTRTILLSILLKHLRLLPYTILYYIIKQQTVVFKQFFFNYFMINIYIGNPFDGFKKMLQVNTISIFISKYSI